MTASARRFITEEAILPCLWGSSLVYGQRAIIERESIEPANSAIRFFLRLHRNKAEPARFAGEFILYDFHIQNASDLCKEILQVELSGRK